MPSRPLVVTYDNFAFLVSKSNRQQQIARTTKAAIATSDETHSSVLRLLLIIRRRRSKRVGLVSSCVWFSSELGSSEKAASSSWESATLSCRIYWVSL